MSKIRQVISLYHKGKSKLFISEYLSLSRNTVIKYINHFKLLQLSYTTIDQKTDLELEKMFFGIKTVNLSDKLEKLYGFFPYADKQLKKPGMTKLLLWQEYKHNYPDGVQSTQFCEHFKRWSKRTQPTMHIPHKAGDKMYVDYAGKTLEIIDKDSGEVIPVQFFIAVLGASQYTYAEASLSQGKENFVNSLQRALQFFGGVPAAIVPDNLKSAVTRSDRYEPTINETLLDFARHYGTTILPARAYKPRDKSLVEGAVRILYQRVYTKLYGHQFFSLYKLNAAISKALREHNERTLTGRSCSRYQLFMEVEKQELSALSTQPYVIKYQSMATVMQNGHVQLSKDKHYYSVPYQFIGRKVKILYSKNSVEIFYKYNRIATHQRNWKKYDYTTHSDHLASTHKFITEWTPKRFTQWAASIDEVVKEYISKILEGRQHPEQAYKSCLGVLSLLKKKDIGKERLVNACKMAINMGIYNYKAIDNILANELDKVVNDVNQDRGTLPEHPNTRGNKYYK